MNVNLRLRAIFCCLYFGIMYWRVYERECHYAPGNYWGHLLLNVGHAWTWIAHPDRIEQEDIDFEKEVNPSWPSTFRTMIGGLL